MQRRVIELYVVGVPEKESKQIFSMIIIFTIEFHSFKLIIFYVFLKVSLQNKYHMGYVSNNIVENLEKLKNS